MGRYTGPVCRLCRREGVKLFLKGARCDSPKCAVTRKGMAGGYSYKRVQVAGDERYRDKPDKNRFSHPCDAAQYMMLGAGEGRSVIPLKRKKRDDDLKLERFYAEQDRHGVYANRVPRR